MKTISKEILINGYVKNNNKTLLNAFTEECKRLGVGTLSEMSHTSALSAFVASDLKDLSKTKEELFMNDFFITVEEFLKAGNLFTDGDSFVCDDEFEIKVSESIEGINYCDTFTANESDDDDDSSFVIYAKCLDKTGEEQRLDSEIAGNVFGIRTTYEECDFAYAWSALEHYQTKGGLYFNEIAVDDDFNFIKDFDSLCFRVEEKMTEREIFIERSIGYYDSTEWVINRIGDMFDNGCRYK